LKVEIQVIAAWEVELLLNTFGVGLNITWFQGCMLPILASNTHTQQITISKPPLLLNCTILSEAVCFLIKCWM